MSASIVQPDHSVNSPSAGKRHPVRQSAKVAVWVLGIPAILLLLLYAVLLITPVRLPFGSAAVEAAASASLPPTSQLSLGPMALALENGVWPVIRFAPVGFTDSKSGAKVSIDALEVGFSPARALFGQPGATVTVVRPHVQIVQDLYGPRLTSFELVEDPAGGPATVRVTEGEDSFPNVVIGARGIDLDRAAGADGATIVRSDNDWLIYNLEASEQGIADLVDQAAQGRFSRLRVRDGVVGMNDSVYGLFRRFEDIDLDIGPSADLRDTHGTFAATLGGRRLSGNVSRTLGETGRARFEADVTNIDFAAILPFIDDASSMAALRGGGALSIDVNFDRARGKLVDGRFKIDATGLDLRLEDKHYPIASSIMDIHWDPRAGRFTLNEAALQIGKNSARVSGVFAMGLDSTFGPTLGIALQARDLVLQPTDMGAPEAPFDSVVFSGWSAPLYGALGIDSLSARKGDAVLEARGRLDLLQAGMGLDLTLVGQGISADDMKRLWPYLMATESRDWFVANVTEGVVDQARMAFDFPVGTMSTRDEEKPIPEGAIQIDLIGKGVAVKPTESMAPVAIAGETRLQVDDANVTVSAGGGELKTASGTIRVQNPAVIIDNSQVGDSIVEVSGDITGAIPAILALVEEQQPDLLAGAELPLDVTALTGVVDAGLVATLRLPDAALGRALSVDYVLNGTVTDFTSTKPIENRSIGNGQLAFSASQDGYRMAGTAEIDGIAAEVDIAGTPQGDPVFGLSASMDVAQLGQMGFDASEFLSGRVRFVARPGADGSLQMAVDLKDAALSIRDIGISKPVGQEGSVSAVIVQDGAQTVISDIELAFGSVRAKGELTVDGGALVSADFPEFALSNGDSASLAVTPVSGGYGVRIAGTQLDLRPMLKRFFGLNEGAGGVQSSQIEQALVLDVELDRALGFYATTAFNLDLALRLRGSDVRQASLTGQFSDGNGVSVTSNPAPRGRTITMAFNDAGTILRFVGVYSQLAGGAGNLVLTTDSAANAEAGRLVMRDFAVVDEDNVAQVLGNHSDSRDAIARQNRLDFDAAEVDFLRRSDRVEVQNAMVAGDTVGGTMRGYIYTGRKQYDLAGTYVPLFGLNSVFQKIPLLGPLLGGRDGEGLVGVTFAIQGALDRPEFKINPLSALAPGVFRELFEFRAQELPQAE